MPMRLFTSQKPPFFFFYHLLDFNFNFLSFALFVFCGMDGDRKRFFDGDGDRLWRTWGVDRGFGGGFRRGACVVVDVDGSNGGVEVDALEIVGDVFNLRWFYCRRENDVTVRMKLRVLKKGE